MSSKKPPKMPKTAKKYDAKKLSGSNKQETLTYVLGGVAIAAIIALIVIFVVIPGSDKTRSEDFVAVVDQPISLTSEDTILVGDPGAPTQIDLFEDFLCPHCASFEETFGGPINEAINDGQLAVNYRILDFLNDDTEQSTRSAAAMMCLAESGDAEVFSRAHADVLSPEVQSKRGSVDNKKLADYAKSAGASDETVTCIEDGKFVDDAESAAKASAEYQIATVGEGPNTPMVLFEGQKIDYGNANWLSQVIATADSGTGDEQD